MRLLRFAQHEYFPVLYRRTTFKCPSAEELCVSLNPTVPTISFLSQACQTHTTNAILPRDRILYQGANEELSLNCPSNIH